MTKKDKAPVREYFELLVETAVFVFFVLTFVLQAFEIPSGSMIPKLLIGDFLLVNKMAYAGSSTPLERFIMPSRPIQRKDIVVFRWPGDMKTDYVKRVIGLPGDKVEIRAKQLYVNEQAVEEPYKIHKTGPAQGSEDGFRYDRAIQDNYGPIVVPPASLFVLGDNRDDSADSRSWGYVPLANIKGRPWMIYFSYDAEPGAYLKTSFKDRLQKLARAVTKARWGRFPKIIG
jgi:signal peptidase I